ncbi:MAG: DUF1080 domain-containing protein [Acidobacteriia bacterium]|nr:DUF1080 domain-containing protein [Terriglobia bacterium]
MKLPAILFAAAAVASAASSPFAGRWDLTVTTPQATYPSWMEFADESPTPAIRVVGRTGSVHPGTDVKVDGDHLSFKSSEGNWDITVSGHKLSGVQHRSRGADTQFTGVPAPSLKRQPPAAWTAPEALFNGKDLTGWEVDDPSKTYWSAQNGELRNDKGGANIHTTRKFEDLKLHIEYNCPQGGNSGVYLRGRYEVQVEYEPAGKNDQFHSMGSIYGFLAPSEVLPPKPGDWESYDVTLVGRTVTVIRDGVKIIDNQEIPGITGGALDSHESEPGPIYLQGDHTGGLKYRNITISLPKR